MTLFDKHFTLNEASQLIPWVRATFARIAELGAMLDDAASAAPRYGFLKLSGNGHSRYPATSKGQIMHEMQEHIDALVQKGLIIQDVERGLIDFPGWRAGEEVLICYELADGDEIVAWHSLNSGYAGRRPVDEALE